MDGKTCELDDSCWKKSELHSCWKTSSIVCPSAHILPKLPRCVCTTIRSTAVKRDSVPMIGTVRDSFSLYSSATYSGQVLVYYPLEYQPKVIARPSIFRWISLDIISSSITRTQTQQRQCAFLDTLSPLLSWPLVP